MLIILLFTYKDCTFLPKILFICISVIETSDSILNTVLIGLGKVFNLKSSDSAIPSVAD